MPTAYQAQSSIAAALLAHLQAANCVRGCFSAAGATAPFELIGERADGTLVLLQDFDTPSLSRPVAACFEPYYASAGCARLTATLDVATGHSIYELLTPAQLAARTQAEKHPRLGSHTPPPRNRSPFGAALAAQVAAALSRGLALKPYHRDYCGMGLECCGGHFLYGEVWDGQALEVQLSFSSREDFVRWLARQSNRSLARLEETDAWYWNNQTVTRQRLLALVWQ